MAQAMPLPFSSWQNFYEIVGSSAGALTGAPICGAGLDCPIENGGRHERDSRIWNSDSHPLLQRVADFRTSGRAVASARGISVFVWVFTEHWALSTLPALFGTRKRLPTIQILKTGFGTTYSR